MNSELAAADAIRRATELRLMAHDADDLPSVFFWASGRCYPLQVTDLREFDQTNPMLWKKRRSVRGALHLTPMSRQEAITFSDSHQHQRSLHFGDCPDQYRSSGPESSVEYPADDELSVVSNESDTEDELEPITPE